MNEATTIKSLSMDFDDLYNDIVDLQALLTVFTEALWRMHNGGGSIPTDDTLLPRFADIAEHHSYKVKNTAAALYREINSLCGAEKTTCGRWCIR